MPTILEIINKTTSFFESKGIDNAKYDAQHLIAFGLGMERMDLYLKFDQPLQEEDLTALRPLVGRRGNREPLQHIVGKTGFRNLDLKCDNRALIPRPDTEGIVDIVSELTKEKEHLSILDIGVGTGAIILSIAQEITGHTYTGTDISHEALSLAQENAIQNNLTDTIRFLQADLFSSEVLKTQRPFDIIVSNPPYITSQVITELEPEVKEYDPMLALDGGTTGLDWYTQFFNEVSPFLKEEGFIVLEIGYDQKQALTQLIESTIGISLIEVKKDYSENDRFVIAQKK
ncbi:MAG: peptide chain release factor N(5)-glutamine methyltransferase [Fibrobacterales bacterium]